MSVQVVLGLMALVMSLLLFWTSLHLFFMTRRRLEVTSRFHVDGLAVIAHRGGSLEAPENTLQAFDQAVALDPNIIIELDVHLTKDEHVVVFHDETLERTTNGEGPVGEKTLEELKSLDAAYHFKNSCGQHPFRGQGVTIPTLEEVLERYPETRFIFEMKGENPHLADKSLEIILHFNRQEDLVCFSQNPEPVNRLRQLAPHWCFGATVPEVRKSVLYHRFFMGPADPMVADIYSIPEKHEGASVLTRSLMKTVQERGKKVFVWTVNERQDMKRLIDFGVDGIITDCPTVLLNIVKEERS